MIDAARSGALLGFLLEPEAAAAKGLRIQQALVRGVDEAQILLLGNQGAFDQVETVAKHFQDGGPGVDTVRVELDPRDPAQRQNDEQIATLPNHPYELGNGLEIPVVIQNVPVTTQADVLEDVHATDRIQTIVRERQLREVFATRRQSVQLQRRRPVITKCNGHPRRCHRNEVERGGKVIMQCWFGALQNPAGPCRMVNVVAVEPSLLGVLIEDRPDRVIRQLKAFFGRAALLTKSPECLGICFWSQVLSPTLSSLFLFIDDPIPDSHEVVFYTLV